MSGGAQTHLDTHVVGVPRPYLTLYVHILVIAAEAVLCFFFPHSLFCPILDMFGGAQTHLDNHFVGVPFCTFWDALWAHSVSITSPHNLITWGPKLSFLPWDDPIFCEEKDGKAGFRPKGR